MVKTIENKCQFAEKEFMSISLYKCTKQGWCREQQPYGSERFCKLYLINRKK